MAKQTVDFGIDLGTTNSAIARMEKRSPRIIRNRYQSDITPSAVAVAKDGTLLVGQDALRDYRLTPALKFKRFMGTNQTFEMADGSRWTPVELSAEVLKELKASVRRRYDEDLTHAVITVPAMFQQPQCEATYQAARLAGIEAVALLQEPIAAATAYLSEQPEDGYYLVFDLGGGTFDVSLLRVDSGEMVVVAHGGDNFLGGSDFDERIARWVIGQLEQGYGSQSQLGRGEKRWRLLQECERAKILLTDEEQTFIDLSDLDLPINKINIDRATLEELVEDLVDKTIVHTQKRLNDAGIKASDVNAILLVGGPTQMPYIRKRLRTEFDVPVMIEDPMTIVALGAAIYASTLPKPTDTRVSIPENAVVLELHYDTVSPTSECTVSGCVTTPAQFDGEIRIIRSGEDWETGWMRLKKGAFVSDLKLREDESITEFKIEARDKQGNLCVVIPNSIMIRLGAAPAKPVTPYNYGVALDDGSMDVIIEGGTTLPAYGRPKEYRTKRAVHAGTDDEFVIYFLEGNSPVARDNVKVGELRLTGRNFPRTIPEGERVEIRMRMDASRRLTAKVYIHLVDEEYDVELRSEIIRSDEDTLRREIEEARKMIAETWEHADEATQQRMQRTGKDIDSVQQEWRSGRISPDEASQRISHIKQELRPVYNQHRIDAEHQQVIELIEEAERLCEHFGDQRGLVSLKDLQREADKCKRLQDRVGLESVRKRVMKIHFEHAQKTGEFWAGFILWLINQAPRATNPIAYQQAIMEATQALEQGNPDAIASAIHKARQYLPDDVVPPSFGDTIIGR